MELVIPAFYLPFSDSRLIRTTHHIWRRQQRVSSMSFAQYSQKIKNKKLIYCCKDTVPVMMRSSSFFLLLCSLWLTQNKLPLKVKSAPSINTSTFFLIHIPFTFLKTFFKSISRYEILVISQSYFFLCLSIAFKCL